MSRRFVYLLLIVISFINIANAQLQSIDIFVDNDITCENDTVQLNILIVQNGYNNLQFDWDNESTITNESVVNPKAFPGTTTTYHVTVTDLDNSITLEDSILITVLPKPIIYAGDDATVCLDQNFLVINAFANNTTVFEWEHTGLGQLLQMGTLTPVYAPATGETGRVDIILKSGGILTCQDVSDTLTLQIIPTPEVTLKTISDTICAFENYIVEEPTIQNATNFEWVHNGEGTLLRSNTLTPEYVPSKNESAIVDIVITCKRNNLCPVSDTLKLSVVAKPKINISEKEVNICSATSYYFSGNIIEHATDILWSHNGNGRLYNIRSVNPVYIPVDSDLEVVQISVEATGRCGNAYDTVSLSIFNADAIGITSDTAICSNQTITLSVDDGYTYSWNTGETSSSIDVNPQSNTTYTVTVDNGQGCSIQEDINITVKSINVDASPDATVCEGGETTISVTASPNYSYSWNTGATTNAIIVQPDSDTDYTVNVSTTEGCIEDVSINVDVRESPMFDIDKPLFPENTIEVDPFNYSNYTFIKNELILQDGSSYSYTFDDTFEDGDSIFVVVTDDFGCVAEDFYLVELPFIPLIGEPIANAFSPNNDGINDRFLQGIRIVVFDRSKRILFDGNDGWDGTLNGRDMPRGTYYHIAYNDDGEIIYKGPVTLVR